MQVSDYLTWIAEVVVEQWSMWPGISLAQPMASRARRVVLGQTTRHPGFIVVAYGKMGGIEMGYTVRSGFGFSAQARV